MWQLVLLPAGLALFIGRYGLQLERLRPQRYVKSYISPTIAAERTRFARARHQASLYLRRPPSIPLTLLAMLLVVAIIPFQLAQLALLCADNPANPLTPTMPQTASAGWNAAAFLVGFFELLSFVLIEEFVFRGWLLFGVRSLVGAPVAVLITSYLFATGHFLSAPVGLPFLFSGVVFGTAVVLSGSIWSGVALHLAYNVGVAAWGRFTELLGARPVTCEGTLPVFLLLATALFYVLWAGRRRRSVR